jgi:amino acid transporter
MVSQFPLPGGQFALAGRFVSPELGFAMGVLFWYKYVLPALDSSLSYKKLIDFTTVTSVCQSAISATIRSLIIYAVVLPAEISAAAVLISYWTPAGDVGSTCTTGICNNAMWVGLMLIIVVSIMNSMYGDISPNIIDSGLSTSLERGSSVRRNSGSVRSRQAEIGGQLELC